MSVESESRALHEQVRHAAAQPTLDGAAFEALALSIARFQATHSVPYRSLVQARGEQVLRSLHELAPVPTDVFRLRRVCVHPPALDERCFFTSGTTTERAGRHYFRTTRTYADLATRYARKRLLDGSTAPVTVVGLAPAPSEQPHSSLGFMMAELARRFDGRPLRADTDFDAGRWLATPRGVDVAGVRQACDVALQRGEELLLLSTSFALVHLLDALAGAALPLPVGSVVMTTGGYKGRSRELQPGELRERVAETFTIDDAQIVAEYGMTELSSQLYAVGEGSAGDGIFYAPPWLRVDPVDPVTFRPVPAGAEGLARFLDLANVDSAVAILTQDLIVRDGAGIRLLGRRPGAELRGCSLTFDTAVLT